MATRSVPLLIANTKAILLLEYLQQYIILYYSNIYIDLFLFIALKSMMNRIISILSLMIVLAPAACGQGLFGARQRPVHHAKGTQWYIGLITEMNHTRATVLAPYSEFSLIDAAATTDKDYRGAGMRAGYGAGISSTLAFTTYIQLSVSAKYNSSTYAYQQEYTWIDPENPSNQLELNDEHTQSLSYLELPISVRYAFPISRFKPFVQAGVLYGRLVEAHKKLVSKSTDYASGQAVQAVRTHQTADVNASYIKSRAGYTLGGGIIYNFGGLMLIVDANYRRGFNNITSAKNRYSATRHLTGMGHVPDDIKLNALSYSVSFLFPLKFITNKDFKPVIF